MIDKIISMVIGAIVIIAAAIIVYVSVFSGTTAEQGLARQDYENAYGNLLIESVLMTNENDTGLTYESLMARSLESLDTNIIVNGNVVDVEEEYEEVLSAVLGEDNYHFTVRPVLKGVSLSYILDGSQTMKPKRQTVNDALPGLIDSLEALFGENASIFTHVYILNTESSGELCDDFVKGPRITCKDLKGDELYDDLLFEGFEPPAPEPYNSFSEWQFSGTAARTTHLSESDWASAAAYASLRYRANLQERSLTNKHVIVAVADELSSSSKADECFGLDDQNDVLFCLLCNDACPTERADGVVNQTAELLQKNQDLFFGFHSLSCDYQYSTSLDQFSLTPYTCKYLDDQAVCTDVRDLNDPDTPVTWVNPPADVNWCEQDACAGCVPDNGAYCFHRNCDQAIIEDLERLAEATQGTVHDLTDLSLLTGTVEQYFTDQVNNFNFTVGAKDDARDRYVVEKQMFLSNGRQIELEIWIYD